MRLAAAAALLSYTLLTAQAGAAQPPLTGGVVDNRDTTGQPTLFGEDDFLLFEVRADGAELTDSFPAYSSRAGVFLPLGEFARLLDLAIVVDPPAQKAQGWVLSEDRHFLLNLRARSAQVAGESYEAPPTQAVLYNHEIYVRADLLQQLLPVKLAIDKSDLSIRLTTREPFPFEQRLERQRLREGIGSSSPATERTMRLPSSYALFTPPSADLTLDAGWSNRSPQTSTSYDLRLGGDLLYAGLQLFVASDSRGRPATSNVLLERRDPDGRTAGFFGATSSDAGDVYSQALDIGAASVGGRGVTTSSKPLDQATAFSTTDIRGPLPAGYEVELYVNEVLRGSTAQAVLGNYEFVGVPLTYGTNTVRLVFYGPHGEHSEEVRHINVGTAQLARGQTVYSFSAIEQDTPVVQLSASDPTPAIVGAHRIRAVGSLSYGLSDTITLIGGVAQYTPNFKIDDRQRQMATAGAAVSLLGFTAELNAAGDNRGGLAFAGSLGGHISDISVLARLSDYSGGFVDELQYLDLSSPSPLRRASQLTANWSPQLPLLDITLPISLHGEQSQYADGSSRLLGEANISTTVDRYNVSAGWEYQRTTSLLSPANVASVGTLAVSALVWQSWELRANAIVGTVPKWQIDAAELTVDGRISDDISARFDAQQSFAQQASLPSMPFGSTPPPAGNGTTTLTAALTWRFSHFDVSFNASFTPQTSTTQLGVQLNLGALFDPVMGDYRPVRAGAAAGGNVALDAFIDKNGDGVHEPDEPGVAGIVAQGGNYPATSNANGDLLLDGLGDSGHVRIRIDSQSIPDPYLTAPADVVEIVPHPGQVAVVAYPLTSLGEAMVKVLFSVNGSPPQGLSALQLQLVSGKGTVAAEGRSEYDGTAIFERVPPGTFSLRIEPIQARQLGLVLTAPVMLTIPASGGYVSGVIAMVTRQ